MSQQDWTVELSDLDLELVAAGMGRKRGGGGDQEQDQGACGGQPCGGPPPAPRGCC